MKVGEFKQKMQKQLNHSDEESQGITLNEYKFKTLDDPIDLYGDNDRARLT